MHIVQHVICAQISAAVWGAKWSNCSCTDRGRTWTWAGGFCGQTIKNHFASWCPVPQNKARSFPGGWGGLSTVKGKGKSKAFRIRAEESQNCTWREVHGCPYPEKREKQRAAVLTVTMTIGNSVSVCRTKRLAAIQERFSSKPYLFYKLMN